MHNWKHDTKHNTVVDIIIYYHLIAGRSIALEIMFIVRAWSIGVI